MVKKRGLGKSLDALLAYTSTEALSQEEGQQKTTEDKLSFLTIDCIERGKYQPRRDMDPTSLEELASSIRSQGIIQPLIVRPIGQNQYEIIAGERRYRAAKMAGLTEVPVIIRHIPDEDAIAIALIENIQRQNLNPIEEAGALKRLLEEFGMTHQEVAEAVGKSRTSVTNLLRLLNLPNEIKSMLEKGMLEMGHARTLITLPESSQIEAANLILQKGLSVRETEELVKQLQNPKLKTKENFLDPDIQHLQETLSHHLKLKVAIHCNARGKGKLVIHYRNLTELDQLIAQFEV